MAKSTRAGALLGSLNEETGSPRMRAAASADIADALAKSATWGDVAANLKISRDTLERMREEFPWVFAGFEKSS